MFEKEKIEQSFKKNFDEYYSFFHWKPDVIRYRKTLNYLIAKGLITKELNKNEVYYCSTEKGTELINSLSSSYKVQLCNLAVMIVKDISKLSDSKIEEEIRKKTNICNRVLEV